MSPGPNSELPAEPLSSLGSLLRITVSRQRDVHLAYVRPAGRDIRRRKGPNTLVASGLSNDDIAERLVISPATAKTHVNRTMMKLNARDRAQLVIIAYETGLITPGRKSG